MEVTDRLFAGAGHVQKRAAQGGALCLAAVLLIVGAVTCMPKADTKVELVSTEGVEAARTSGVIAAVSDLEVEAESAAEVAIANSEVTVVAATTDETEPEEDDEYDVWNDTVMTTADDYMYIRAEASTDADVVGKLKSGDLATLIDVFDGWYEVESGNAHGYVSAELCVTGLDAYEHAMDVCPVYATTTTSGLRLRSEASQDSKILKTIPLGTKLIVDTEAEEVDGWVAVSSAGKSGYVSAEFVDISMETGEAMTVEEEAAAKAAAEEAAQKAKEAAEAAAAANKAIIDNAGDLMLLAAIIQVEAGEEPYEGQVSVGAVVMNRVKSGSYPNTVYDVIYAKGQFSTGRIISVLQKGAKQSCIQAAQAAMAGADYTGGATHFRRAGNTEGLIIGHHVFY